MSYWKVFVVLLCVSHCRDNDLHEFVISVYHLSYSSGYSITGYLVGSSSFGCGHISGTPDTVQTGVGSVYTPST